MRIHLSMPAIATLVNLCYDGSVGAKRGDACSARSNLGRQSLAVMATGTMTAKVRVPPFSFDLGVCRIGGTYASLGSTGQELVPLNMADFLPLSGGVVGTKKSGSASLDKNLSMVPRSETKTVGFHIHCSAG